MAENPSEPGPVETDEALSPTGGLPADFFEVPESPASDPRTPAIPVRDGPLPPRIAGVSAAPRVVVEQRASLPVVLVVIAGNILFFLGGGLAGWAAARRGAARTEPVAARAINPPLGDVMRDMDARMAKSVSDVLGSRLDTMQAELGTLGRELARLDGRLNAKTNAPTAPPDLVPLETKIDDLVEKSQKLSPLPATFQSLGQRVDALDKGLNTLRTEVAAVPKQLDASLNALKNDVESRAAPAQVNPADIGRELGVGLFREGKYAGARELFLSLAQNTPDDARLWYFAALASGLTSGDWAGDAERMVRRGLACEQKGLPQRAEIDAQFSSLTREQGKDWLTDWRERARR